MRAKSDWMEIRNKLEKVGSNSFSSIQREGGQVRVWLVRAQTQQFVPCRSFLHVHFELCCQGKLFIRRIVAKRIQCSTVIPYGNMIG